MPAKYESHPLADIFPPMTKAELAALAEDIKANGLQLPIVLFEGKILDGRSRYSDARLPALSQTSGSTTATSRSNTHCRLISSVGT
jgi:hypothetical protein